MMCARISEHNAPLAAEWAEQQLCASTRADGCRPSEADSEPRVATGILSQKVSHGVRPLDGVCEHGGVLRCCDVDSPQFLPKKSLASTERRKPSSGLQRSLEAVRRSGGSG